MSQPDHPSRDELRAYSSGDVTDEELDRITVHLEGCPECRRVLDSTPDDDKIVLLLRGGRQESGPTTALQTDAESSGHPFKPSVQGYEILEELGRGAMGVVFKARQIGLNRLVALKVLLAARHATPDQRVRFHRDAESLARLNHTNIVQVYDYNTSATEWPYLALELMATSLARRLGGMPLPPAEAARLLAPLASAVQHAHERGVVHRDLKPANVLLGEDGIVKVSDFGLARRLDQQGSLTDSGTVAGTPSYMAPEQAGGMSAEAGPPADVWALGAILYEMVTGRPPFQAPTPLDILKKVRDEDPHPPRRLQPKIPRDLETICLKCLHKEPHRRYQSAADLAEDLRRFLGGDEIRARPVGRIERGMKWVTKTRARVVNAILGTVLIAVLVSVVSLGTWRYFKGLAQQRQEVGKLLELALELRTQRLWEQARRALLDADNRVGLSGPADLRERIHAERETLDCVERDRGMADRLDAACSTAAMAGGGGFNFKGADRSYADAFRWYGLNPQRLDLQLIRASAIREHLTTALDDWSWVKSNLKQEEEAERLLTCAVSVDDDAWRRRVRQAAAKGFPLVLAGNVTGGGSGGLLSTVVLASCAMDGGYLRHLVEQPRAAEQPPSGVCLIARLLGTFRFRPLQMEVLRKGQQRYPGDFWINMELGIACADANPPILQDASRFFTAAIAIRPDNAAAHNNLGDTWRCLRRPDLAVDSLRMAIHLQPNLAEPHNNLGIALADLGKFDEAKKEYEEAIRLRPSYAAPHSNLGLVLQAEGQRAEAIREFNKAIELEPDSARTHFNLGISLAQGGKLGDAVKEYNRAIVLQPDLVEAYNNLGNLLRKQGKMPEAIAVLQAATRHNPQFALAHYNLGIGLSDVGRAAEAASAYQAALRLRGDFAEAYIGLGDALVDERKPEEAVVAYRYALLHQPTSPLAYNALGLALQAQGDMAGAVAAYRDAIRFGPKLPEPSVNLRRVEPFLVLEGKLPALLKGEAQPANASEAVQLAQLCEVKRLYAPAARFFAYAFEQRKELAEDAAGHRYNATCLAVLASQGRGKDSAELDDTKRADLRRQALLWLQDDLKQWTRHSRNGNPAARKSTRETLRHWLQDPDLTSVRDKNALDNMLPRAEGEEWRKLWRAVAALLKQVESND